MSNLVNGTYKVRGVSAELGYTSKGNEQVGVLLQILSEGFENETITWFGSFSEAAQDRTLEALRHLGWSSDDLFDLSGIGSKEAYAVLEEEEFQGKVSMKVKWINAAGGLAMKAPMNEAQARAFSARMKGAVLASKSKVGGGAKPAGAPPARGQQQRSPQRGYEPPPPTDDDQIPF